MSVQYITWNQAREMVSARLRQWISSMPPSERMLKILWGQQLLSPNDMLRHVEVLDELGRQIVATELRKISEEIGVTYIISG